MSKYIAHFTPPVFYGGQATPPPMKNISGIFHFLQIVWGIGIAHIPLLATSISYAFLCMIHINIILLLHRLQPGLHMFVMLDINIIYVLHNTYIIVQVI